MYFKRSFFICRHIVSYRDDGLGIIRSKSPRSAEILQQTKLKLPTIQQTELTNFIRKLQLQSPRQILKQLPETINRRLIKLSNNEKSFNNVKNEYQKALNSVNYKNTLKYDKTTQPERNKKQRKRHNIFQPTI